MDRAEVPGTLTSPRISLREQRCARGTFLLTQGPPLQPAGCLGLYPRGFDASPVPCLQHHSITEKCPCPEDPVLRRLVPPPSAAPNLWFACLPPTHRLSIALSAHHTVYRFQSSPFVSPSASLGGAWVWGVGGWNLLDAAPWLQAPGPRRCSMKKSRGRRDLLGGLPEAAKG